MAAGWPPARTAHPRRAVVGRESTRPPRYRLMRAAARIPQREPEEQAVSFLRACPACGLSVVFTQVTMASGPGYLVEQHACVEPDQPG